MGASKFLLIALPFAAFTAVPVLFLLVSALGDGKGELTLEHLELLRLSARQIGLLENSLLVSLGASAFAVLAGVPLALVLHRTDVWGRAFFRKAYLASLILPPYIQALVWTKYLNLEAYLPWCNFFSIPGGVFVFGLSYFPFVTLITSSGLQSLDPSLEEAARIQGGAWPVLRKVTLPLVFPHVTSGAILVFVFTIINFEVADILRLNVYPMEIFIYFSAYYDERSAAVLSAPLIGAAMVFIWGQMRYMRGKSYVNLGRATGQTGYFLGRWRVVAALFPGGMIFLSLVLPVAALFRGAGAWSNYANAWKGGAEAMGYSLWVGFVSAACMVMLSLPVSYYLAREKGRLRSLVDFSFQISFGVPSIVLGIGFITVWNRPVLDAVYGTSVILVMAMVAAYSPFVIKVISAAIARVDRELEDAGIMAVKGSKVFFRIVFPLAAPGMLAGFAVGFVLTVSNLGTALLIVAPGKLTLPIAAYNFMHYGADETVCALGLMLLSVVALPLLIIIPIYKKLARRWE